MVKADDLIKVQKERESRKYITFDKIFQMVENKIQLASAANFYFTWCQIPEFLIGLPSYSLDESLKFVEDKLKKNGFETEFYSPNIILIKWFPKEKGKK